MPEAVLVLLRQPEEAASVLGAALQIAELMGRARINALAIRETVQLAPAGAATLASRSDAVVAAEDMERQRTSALHVSFNRWTAAARECAVEAHWFEAAGDTADLAAQWGRRADLIVTERPRQEDRLARQALRMALFGTDRPILMVPPQPSAAAGPGASFGRRVAIAWSDEKPAVKAVLPALRWLAGAEELHVLVGVRDMSLRLEIPSVLVEHGLKPSLHMLSLRPGPFGQTLLDKAHEISADLLVMGAYAHSPLHELVLGGVTRHMLAHADLPVLMRH